MYFEKDAVELALKFDSLDPCMDFEGD